MSEVDVATEVADVVVTPPASTPDTMGAREAGRLLASLRKPKESKPVAAEAQPAPVQESTAQAEDAGQETVPSETQETDPVELPPIDAPRSWTKEDKELFAGLPRETQERLAQRERSRDTDFSKRQQKATEEAKAFEAERSKVEQARQQYESALPILMENLQAGYNGEFADIKSWADVQKMQSEDFLRYQR